MNCIFSGSLVHFCLPIVQLYTCICVYEILGKVVYVLAKGYDGITTVHISN